MKSINVFFLLISFFALNFYAEDISWNFDNDTEGWQIVDLVTFGPYSEPLGYYSLNHISTGGMPDGYIQGNDPTNNTFAFCMPDSVVENIDTFLNGNISYYLRCTHNNWTAEPYLILVCDTDDLISEFPLPTSDWQHYSIDFVRENFYLYDGGELSQSYFETLLQNVEHIFIIAEYGDGVYEVTDLDSVILSDINCGSLTAPELVISEINPVSEQITLTWNSVPAATSYKVYELASPYDSAVEVYTVSDTIFTLSFSTNFRFYYVTALCGE